MSGDLQMELVEVGDLFESATNLRPLVTGHAGNKTLGHEGEWTARVVGTDPETGQQVTVASYGHSYQLKKDAAVRSKELFKFLTSTK